MSLLGTIQQMLQSYLGTSSSKKTSYLAIVRKKCDRIAASGVDETDTAVQLL